MDKQVQNLKELVFPYIGKTPMQVRSILGSPKDTSTEAIWFYEVKRFGFYHQEMAFSFKNSLVANISIIKYLMGFKMDEQILYGNE